MHRSIPRALLAQLYQITFFTKKSEETGPQSLHGFLKNNTEFEPSRFEGGPKVQIFKKEGVPEIFLLEGNQKGFIGERVPIELP